MKFFIFFFIFFISFNINSKSNDSPDLNFKSEKKVLWNEWINQIKEELQKEGMTFVTVDQAAFIEQSEEAIYESLSPEMKRTYESIKTLTK